LAFLIYTNSLKKIIVASKNPVKKNATLEGFQSAFPNAQFKAEGISAPSGVSDQPMSDLETFQGAKNRAEYIQKNNPLADYWVGIEGGIDIVNNEMEVFAWIYIVSKVNEESKIGKAKTGTFYLPKQIQDLINKGYELGEADDTVFQKNNSKQKGGSVGILTNNIITRTSYYQEAVVLALIPFLNSDLY